VKLRRKRQTAEEEQAKNAYQASRDEPQHLVFAQSAPVKPYPSGVARLAWP